MDFHCGPDLQLCVCGPGRHPRTVYYTFFFFFWGGISKAPSCCYLTESKPLTLSYSRGGCRIVPSVAKGLNDDACRREARSNESSYRRCTQHILKEDCMDTTPFYATLCYLLQPPRVRLHSPRLQAARWTAPGFFFFLSSPLKTRLGVGLAGVPPQHQVLSLTLKVFYRGWTLDVKCH